MQWVHWQWGREQLPSHSVTKHHIDRIIMMILMILTILICLYVFAVKDIQERLLGLMKMSSFLRSLGRREPDGLKRSHEGWQWEWYALMKYVVYKPVTHTKSLVTAIVLNTAVWWFDDHDRAANAVTKHLLEITVTNQDEAATWQYASNEPVPMKRFSQNMKSYLAKAATLML